MNIFLDIRTLVTDTIATLVSSGVLPPEVDTGPVTLETPRDPSHGDMSTNAALVLARSARTKPRQLAEQLATVLETDHRVQSIDIAGPGFINLTLTPSAWRASIPAALNSGNSFGRPDLGKGRSANVEFVSANPTGPLHVAHARGAAFGDALANLLDFAGYDVTREYYVNDGGAQVEVLARSAYLRYLEANGRAVEFAADGYPGDYLIPVGEALYETYGDRFVDEPESEWLDLFREFATGKMMDIIRDDLAALGIRMDVFFSERSLYDDGRIDDALRALDERGLIYRGRLEPPLGKSNDEWESREQTLFRSTDHGDDMDRAIRKHDGSWTYFAPDIAYHHDKILRGFDELINVFGYDHGGYVKRITAVVAALSDQRVPIDIRLVQLVRLLAGSKPIKMSKRAGTFVTLRQLVDEVGPDVARFVMLTRKNDVPHWTSIWNSFGSRPATIQSSTSSTPTPEICSVLKKAAAEGIDVSDSSLADARIDLVGHEAELALIRRIAGWPRQLELAARNREPHRIAFALGDIAAEFHSLWNRSKTLPELHFLQATARARLAVCRATAIAISTGLGIMGVTPVEEMR